MIFIEFSGQPRRLRVNGQATIREGKSGSDAKLIISVTATEIFPNCPRYVPDLQSNKPSKFLPYKSGMVPNQIGRTKKNIEIIYLRMIHIILKNCSGYYLQSLE
jgi:hypothetical protein